MRRLWGLILFGMIFPAASAAQSEPDVLAVVNGEEIRREEVLDAVRPELQELESADPRSDTYARDRLQLLWTGLDARIEERLIALEADSLNMTEAQFLDIEIESNIITPSEAEVDAFYEQNQSQIPLPRAEALPQVRQYMIDQQRRSLRRSMIQTLKARYGVTTHLEPLRTSVAVLGHPARGPVDAPVTIVEFGDFQCPFCGSLYPTLERVREVYGDQVRIVYRHFPLRNIHPQAQKAAEAAMCANDQGRFWEFHDSLYENQNALEIADLEQRARELGLDGDRFDQCLSSGAKANVVQFDLDEGRAAGVSGTPTLFINGRFLSGPQPRDIQAVIEDELRRAGGSGQ